MFRIRSVSCAEMQCSTPQCKNLPVSLVSNSEKAHESASEVLYKVTMTTDEGNNNLSPAEKELLRWHYRLGHVEFAKVKHLMRTGVLSSTAATRPHLSIDFFSL